jgi:predicted nuclease of predicted toxin-antitoxin system
VKLLFDENLSPRLVELLADVFPGSAHVRDVGLASATDADVWAYAKLNALTIVSKDADFRQVSFLHGQPPKVVWLHVGNRSTAGIQSLVRAHVADLLAFDADPVAALLVLTA